MSKFLNGLYPYCGGKWRLLKLLLDYFGICYPRIFIDLCGGSGVVTENAPFEVKIINEINPEIAIIFKALSHNKYADPFSDILSYALEPNEETYEEARKYLREHEDNKLEDYSDDELPLAAAYSLFIRFFSRSGNDTKGEPIFSDSKIKKWYNLVEKDICKYREAYDGVIVWNLDIFDALKKIEEEIHEEAIIYIDPPYLSDKNSDIKTDTAANNSRTYSCGLSESNHIKMLQILNTFPTSLFTIFISNYENEAYDSLLATKEFSHWEKHFLKEIYIMCGNGALCSTQGRKTANEFLYFNFPM